jgi:hypothetical protein
MRILASIAAEAFFPLRDLLVSASSLEGAESFLRRADFGAFGLFDRV